MLWRYSRQNTKVLLVATLLVFAGYGLLIAGSWREVALEVGPQAANTVGISLGVPENEVNVRLAQLDAREAALAERERALAEVRGTARTDSMTLLLITLVGIGLLGLILLNFYLDLRRRHSLAS